MSMDEYAKNTFGDLAVARVVEAPTSFIWHTTINRLEIEADEEIETGDFCDGEMVYLKMKSGRLAVHKIFDRFCAIAQPQLRGPVVPAGNTLLIYDDSSGIELLNLVGDKSSTVLRSKFALDFIRIVGRQILFVADYCLVCTAMLEQPSKYSTVVTSSNRICAFDVNGNSNTIAVGTEQCLVNVYSLSNGELNSVIGLNSLEPEKLLVTPSWALIIILTHSEVLVYSVNGTFVDKMTVERGIRDWKAFSNGGGFDYVAFIDDGSRIGVFEAMRPNDVQYLTSPAFRYNLIAVDYLTEKRAVAGLTKDGDVAVTPLETGSC
jgi:WD40 repeat protein